MLDLYTQSINDARRFMNGEFSVALDFVATTSETASIKGWTTKHHLAFDVDGNPINSKTVHVTFSEQDLTALNYPVRNSNSEVEMINHLVTVKDSTQNPTQFKVAQYFPDERLGLITLILNDFV